MRRYHGRKVLYWCVVVLMLVPGVIYLVTRTVSDLLYLLAGPMTHLRDWSHPDQSRPPLPDPSAELSPGGRPDDRTPI